MNGRLVIAMMLGLLPPAAGSGQELDTLISPGPLSRFHDELGGLRNCTSCHAPGKGVADDRCLACHEDLAIRMRAARGFHRDKQECALCHPEHQGADFALVQWDRSGFDHAATGYDLVGLHRQVETCEGCHRPPNAVVRKKSVSYFLNDTTCTGCHADVHRGQLGKECQRCHGMDSPFRNVRFDHAATAFPLVGAHRTLACDKCHAGGKWKGIPSSRCTDCHRDPHRPTLGSDCTRCHRETSWKATTFDHSRTRYPLEGKHRSLECGQCHREGLERKFRGVAFEKCTDCHRKDPHFGQLEGDCSRCHVVASFLEVSVDHAASRYPLTGEHVPLACDKCHRLEHESSFPAGIANAVRYKPMATACRSCHEDVHVGQLSTSCETCHVTEGFLGEHLLFAHDRDSRFSLRGKHRDILCERCHRLDNGPFPAGPGLAIRYKPISSFCIACHDNVHDEARWRGGEAVRAIDCEQCHSVETFALDSFDHDRTAFRLEGAHRALECNGCHDFALTEGHRFLLFHQGSRDCAACHRSPHLKGMEDCVPCHGQSTWRVGL